MRLSKGGMICLRLLPAWQRVPGQEQNSSTIILLLANRLGVTRQADPGELPSRFWREEIAVSGADMAGRRDARAAAQHKLVAHEFAVVFAHRARRGRVARIRVVGAAGPFPGVAIELGGFRGPASPGGRALGAESL